MFFVLCHQMPIDNLVNRKYFHGICHPFFLILWYTATKENLINEKHAEKSSTHTVNKQYVIKNYVTSVFNWNMWMCNIYLECCEVVFVFICNKLDDGYNCIQSMCALIEFYNFLFFFLFVLSLHGVDFHIIIQLLLLLLFFITLFLIVLSIDVIEYWCGYDRIKCISQRR